MADLDLTRSQSVVRRPINMKKGKKPKGDIRPSSADADSQKMLTGDLLTSFNTPFLDKQGLIQVALRQSLTSGSFIDTKFYAFSRRRSTGVVDEPLAVYANSAMLRAGSKYFEGLLGSGFSEAKPTSLREGFPSDKEKFTGEYDYDSDSDLEDEIGSLESQASIDEERPESDVTKTEAEVSAQESSADLRPMGDSEYYGRVIIIPDVAFNTWKALIFYIYTGEVHFGPLRSQLASTNETRKPTSAPLCSPKSMYRLADKCGIDELREKAKQDILGKLSVANITTELCTSLVSTYDEIRDMHVDFACQKAQRPLVVAFVPQWIAGIASGNSSHTSSTLAAFVAKLSQNPGPKAIDSNTAMLNWTGCSSCGTNNLTINQPIFRYCNFCHSYRNP
ncbi:hypothetical protein BC835DRAFT_1387101 [Cytidiella melzeri]|nr:hypothetical protein BC835DRAFT_1387101 [Cytidiella melzeri]